eukprot:8705552-Pyramimonas_sp.AAC.3
MSTYVKQHVKFDMRSFAATGRLRGHHGDLSNLGSTRPKTRLNARARAPSRETAQQGYTTAH